ncbi:MAG: TonB-dependent receptor [Tannerellaceae bacterium]|jgi:iron complex outermembrane receptor protein|nr:TonB-dependent receptor [Tannerellaceae bacterium]
MDKQRRNTRTKQLILDILIKANSALSREEIDRRLPEKMDRVTLYRILQSFCDEGKLHRIVNAEGETYYALCSGCTAGNHHDGHPHFHCISCNDIICINEPVAKQELPAGYVAASFASYISGFCSKCNALNKLIALFILLTAADITADAQTKVTVMDAESGQAIEYAAVYFPDMKTGGVTDSLGRFTVDLAAPQVPAQISAVGYQTYTGNIRLKQGGVTVYLHPAVHELQEIVAIENSSRLQGENVMNVEKLNLADITIPGLSLARKLASVPGLDNLSSGTGIGKPVIRGLSGNRIAVFSQGLRIENQQWGDEHGLGLDENGYEQVEIIKGPASLLYGSDALGGVLYFVDERYAAEGTLEARAASEFAGNTNGWNNNAALKISKNKLHLNIFGGYNTQADYADGNNLRVRNSRFNTGNLKAVAGYTGRRFTSSLKYGFLGERYGLSEPDEHDEPDDHEEHEEPGDHETPNPGQRTPALPYQHMNTHYLSSENTWFFPNGSKLKIDAGYIANSRREFEAEHEHDHDHEAEHDHDHDHEAALHMQLQTLSWNLKWYSAIIGERLTLTAGNQGMAQSNTNRGEEILVPNAKTFDLGAFALASLRYADNAMLQTGVRLDRRSVSAQEMQDKPSLQRDYLAFNFSAGLQQPVNEAINLRIALSSGFRAPNMYELLSDGIHHGTNRHETGNPNLKTENNFQADLALGYSAKHISLFINPYFNYIRNYIHLRPTGETINNAPAYGYVQEHARLYGGEAGIHLHPHPLDWLHAESSFGSVYGQERNGNYLALMPSQKIRTTISANFRPAAGQPLRAISIYMQHIASLAQNRVAAGEAPTPAYSLLNSGVAVEIRIKKQAARLSLSVNNLLNKTCYDHLSRYKVNGIYDVGRSLHIKLSIPVYQKI